MLLDHILKSHIFLILRISEDYTILNSLSTSFSDLRYLKNHSDKMVYEK